MLLMRMPDWISSAQYCCGVYCTADVLHTDVIGVVMRAYAVVKDVD
jgi:hypothetical protein